MTFSIIFRFFKLKAYIFLYFLNKKDAGIPLQHRKMEKRQEQVAKFERFWNDVERASYTSGYEIFNDGSGFCGIINRVWRGCWGADKA